MTRVPVGTDHWGPLLNADLDSIESRIDDLRDDVAATYVPSSDSTPEKVARALRPFRVACEGAGPVSILCGPSDSIGDGLGASGFDRRWVGRLRAELRSRLSRPGGSFSYADLWNQMEAPDHPVATVAPLANTTWGLGRQSLNLVDPATIGGTVQTITVTGTFTHLDLFFVVTPDGSTGSVQFSLDGGAAFVFNTGAAASARGGYRLEHANLQGLAATPHTLLIAWAGGGPVTIEGVEAFNGDKATGVRVYEAGQSGQTAAFFDPNTSPYWWQTVGTIAPDLCILPIGSNDFATGSTAAAARTHVEAIVDMIPAVSGKAVSIVLMAYYDRDHGSTDSWPVWQQMYRDVAATRDNVCVLDLAPDFGPWINDDRGGLTDPTDRVHPSDAGHALIARRVLRLLGL